MNHAGGLDAGIPGLLFLESVDANSVPGETALEHLRASEVIARERGFTAESVTRGDDGSVITPPGFVDAAFDLSSRRRVAVAARTIESSQCGMPIGSDYVAHHWPLIKSEDLSNFLRLEDYPWPMLYTGQPGDVFGQAAKPRAAFSKVVDVRISNEGDTVTWLEWVRGDGWAASHLVWTEQINGARRRLVANLPSVAAGFSDMSISLDGRWLLVDHPARLVDLQTGHHTTVGSDVWAACWDPTAGPSCLLAVARSEFDEPAELFQLDLDSGKRETVGRALRTTHGMQIAPDGQLAARVNAEAEARQGGYFDELVVTADRFRTFEPVASLRSPPGWRRRCTRPRWTAPWPEQLCRPVVLNDRLETRLRMEEPTRSIQQDEADFVLDAISPRIKHRLARIAEEPSLAVPIIAELRALTETASSLDRDMRESVLAQVVPYLQSALGRTAQDLGLLAEVDAIASLARSERSPQPRLEFEI